MGFAVNCQLARHRGPHHPVSYSSARVFAPRFFQAPPGGECYFSPLRFASPSPPSGWVEDFHLQGVGHTRHTPKRHGRSRASPPIQPLPSYEPLTTSRLFCTLNTPKTWFAFMPAICLSMAVAT